MLITLRLVADIFPAARNAVSAAIVLTGGAWLIGVASGGLAHALHVELAAAAAALGAIALVAQVVRWLLGPP